MKGHVLVVDDEKSICQALKGILEDEGYGVSLAYDGPQGLVQAQEAGPDIVLLDIWMPGMDGLEVLSRLKHLQPQLPVVIISGHGNVETAVKATRLGAFDFVEKPLDMDKILLTVRNALKIGRLAEENLLLRARTERPDITGQTQPIKQLLQSIGAVAPTDSWVLITGGKRHRQGTGGPLHTPPEPTGQRAFRGCELRGHTRGADRK